MLTFWKEDAMKHLVLLCEAQQHSLCADNKAKKSRQAPAIEGGIVPLLRSCLSTCLHTLVHPQSPHQSPRRIHWSIKMWAEQLADSYMEKIAMQVSGAVEPKYKLLSHIYFTFRIRLLESKWIRKQGCFTIPHHCCLKPSNGWHPFQSHFLETNQCTI